MAICAQSCKPLTCCDFKSPARRSQTAPLQNYLTAIAPAEPIGTIEPTLLAAGLRIARLPSTLQRYLRVTSERAPHHPTHPRNNIDDQRQSLRRRLLTAGGSSVGSVSSLHPTTQTRMRSASRHRTLNNAIANAIGRSVSNHRRWLNG